MTSESQTRALRGVYGISVMSELSGVGPQTLRLYERRGLLTPTRTDGGTRRYSEADLDTPRTNHRADRRRSQSRRYSSDSVPRGRECSLSGSNQPVDRRGGLVVLLETMPFRMEFRCG